MFLEGVNVLYVGKAKNLRKRMSQYFAGARTSRTKTMVARATDLNWAVCSSEAEALVLEQQWISAHQPPYNILLKYGNGYAGVAVSSEEVPRLFTWRGSRPAKAHSYGPYPGARTRELTSALSFAFGVRTCSQTAYAAAKSADTPCILADTGHCLAPCVGRVDQEDYRRAAEHLKLFLQGRSAAVLEELRNQMESSSAALEFEKAALARDRLATLEKTLEKHVVSEAGKWSGTVIEVCPGRRTGIALVTLEEGQITVVETAVTVSRETLEPRDAVEEFLTGRATPTQVPLVSSVPTSLTRLPKGKKEKAVSTFTSKQARNAALYVSGTGPLENLQDRQRELVAALSLTRQPRRIEALDVSHTAGRHPVAAFAVVIDGQLARDQVRYVNVPKGGDDVANIAYAASKRFSGSKLGMDADPDVLLVDGGPLQVAAAAQVVPPHSSTFVVGIAKRLEELWVPGEENPVILPRRGALNLLMLARDHAHALAVRKHSAARDAALVKTQLTGLPGLGPKRLGKLMSAFGTVDAVVGATREQFQTILGHTTGAKTWDELHRTSRNENS